MSTGETDIRPVGPADARDIIELVRTDFAAVGERAGIEGLDYVEPTDTDVASLAAALSERQTPFVRLGAFENEKLVAYVKAGRFGPREMAPFVGSCAANALAARHWYKNKRGLYTLATDGRPLESPAVLDLVDRAGVFAQHETYIPTLTGDETMAEFLARRQARRTAFLGDAALRNVTRNDHKCTMDLWHYKPEPIS